MSTKPALIPGIDYGRARDRQRLRRTANWNGVPDGIQCEDGCGANAKMRCKACKRWVCDVHRDPSDGDGYRARCPKYPDGRHRN